ncbi:diacylglycerol/lipid kinase family protein [Tunicatimonas pelagia]|uniref:diacylglycerol/lipid kinase family protein n=1 Tax=Tunicatimonas pelagia TaxID=931531 RepID=UPI002665B00B|nr:diacylglycerol kinase family protein [Tunicatimonas pelagia]WKN42630.1 diacylglycerol kinase family lipid kinase [Tunicatimonas pelagia]
MLAKKKCVFIINPISGVGKQKDIPSLLKQHLDMRRFEYDVVFTEYPGHATEIAEAYRDQVEYVIAVGGDGTINETARALLGSEAVLGIIPLGSGNGFARHLNISTNPTRAIKQLNQSQESLLDVGFLNGHPFFNVSGTGFDALISKRFADQTRRGYATYIRCVWEEITSYQPRTYRYTLDGEEVEDTFFLIAFANSEQYGNNAIIAPQAQTNDGLLDIVFVRPFPAAYVITFTLLAFTRQIHLSPYVEIVQAKQFEVQQLNDSLIHIDGEYVETTDKTLNISLRPQNLKVLRPN